MTKVSARRSCTAGREGPSESKALMPAALIGTVLPVGVAPGRPGDQHCQSGGTARPW